MIGIDAVDIERLSALMKRSPGAEQRLFTSQEQGYCKSRADPVVHYAGTLAVKEAVIKACSLGPLVSWGRRIEVRRNVLGAPQVQVHGFRHGRIDVSISHDGGLAVAVAVVQKSAEDEITNTDLEEEERNEPKPNKQLLRYLSVSLQPDRFVGRPLEPASDSVGGTDFP
ncbi:MAG: holo-ACP synthase [bacterium]